jgi:hypothetical protein
MQLYEALSMHVAAWRGEGYQHADCPVIGEILEWARQPDVPEKKNDLVLGKYVVEAAKGSTLAVKLTDMLGEEVLVVKEM